MMAFRHAEPGEAENLAWWRLHAVRLARLALMPVAEASRLSPLPAPPAKALSWWQGVKYRLGRLRVMEEVAPARYLAKLR